MLYVVHWDGESLTINDTPVGLVADRIPSERRLRGEGPRLRADDLSSLLQCHCSVHFFTGQDAMWLDRTQGADTLLLALTHVADDKNVEELLTFVPPEVNPDTIRTWIANFQPMNECLLRANEELEQLDRIAAENRARNDAVQRAQLFAYPLTTLGMRTKDRLGI